MLLLWSFLLSYSYAFTSPGDFLESLYLENGQISDLERSIPEFVTDFVSGQRLYTFNVSAKSVSTDYNIVAKSKQGTGFRLDITPTSIILSGLSFSSSSPLNSNCGAGESTQTQPITRRLKQVKTAEVYQEKKWLPSNLVHFNPSPSDDPSQFSASDIMLWLSLDKKNRCLRFGVGYASTKNIMLEWIGATEEDKELFAQVWSVTCAIAHPKESRLPVVTTPPPAVIAPEENTFEVISANSAIVPRALPAVAWYQYDVIQHLSVSDAIAYKIDLCLKSSGCFLYEKLQKKLREFGDVEECMAYIRVTLGPDLGDSPGSPYVMEIWPSKCKSPIHDHSNTVAMIKVLYGSIRSTWFNPLAQFNNSVPVPMSGALFRAGDITYLTPQLYQTHQLSNPMDVAAVSIQCYQYPADDSIHYETFDYLDGVKNNGSRLHFVPDSDFSYAELMNKLANTVIGKDLQGRDAIIQSPYD